MDAAPVPSILHYTLIGFAKLVKLGVIPTLVPLAPLIHAAINTLRWGEHRGGMIIEVTGQGENGEPESRSWHMIADGDDGPLIPSMAIEALVRLCLAGRRPRPGARSAVGELRLEDYNHLFARRAIVTGFRGDNQARARHPTLREVAWRRR
jgi:hypothetical protein